MNKTINRYFLASIFLWPLLYFIVNMIFIYINKTPKEKKKFIKRQKKQHIKKHIFQKQQKQEHQQEKEQEHQQEKEQEQQNKKEGFTSYNDCTTQGYTKSILYTKSIRHAWMVSMRRWNFRQYCPRISWRMCL